MHIPTIRGEILLRVERFLVSQRMSATQLGYLSCGDPGLVRKLRAGRDFRSATLDQVQRFMVAETKIRKRRGRLTVS